MRVFKIYFEILKVSGINKYLVCVFLKLFNIIINENLIFLDRFFWCMNVFFSFFFLIYVVLWFLFNYFQGEDVKRIICNYNKNVVVFVEFEVFIFYIKVFVVYFFLIQ